jgi:metal-responsive CopG/Arc/MetJ family transcriptional regulator
MKIVRTIKFDEELWEQIEVVAKKNNRSRNNMVETMCLYYIEENNHELLIK